MWMDGTSNCTHRQAACVDSCLCVVVNVTGLPRVSTFACFNSIRKILPHFFVRLLLPTKSCNYLANAISSICSHMSKSMDEFPRVSVYQYSKRPGRTIESMLCECFSFFNCAINAPERGPQPEPSSETEVTFRPYPNTSNRVSEYVILYNSNNSNEEP